MAMLCFVFLYVLERQRLVGEVKNFVLLASFGESAGGV